MSIVVDIRKGVQLKPQKRRRFLIPALAFMEAALTFILYLSITGRMFSPGPVRGAAGVPELLSYQGRLTDTSGNPLGGAGTVYCFRYSIYDASSGGNKVWPAGTPTNSTTTVTDGIFTDQVGRMDSLAPQDFFTTSTLYLNVEVNTVTSTCSGSWEGLSPRQQIVSAAWTQTAQSVYGDALRTPLSTKVQIGTGAGQATSTMTLLSLDVANVAEALDGSCSNNGSIWYNSAMTKALVCEGGTIKPVSNSSTTISGIGVNASTPITAGTVVFSNSNNVSFGLNGSTITASAAAGGGGGFELKDFALLDRAYMIAITNMTATGVTQRPIFIPFVLPGSLTWNRGDIEVSRATSGSNLFTADFGIYSYVNSNQISLIASSRNTYSGTNTGSQSGIRRILFSIGGNATALTPGQYVMGMKFSASAGTASMNYSLRGASLGPPAGNIFPGQNSYVTATSQLSSMPLARFLGRYTATSADLPGSVSFNQVQHWTSMYRVYFHLEST